MAYNTADVHTRYHKCWPSCSTERAAHLNQQMFLETITLAAPNATGLGNRHTTKTITEAWGTDRLLERPVDQAIRKPGRLLAALGTRQTIREAWDPNRLLERSGDQANY